MKAILILLAIGAAHCVEIPEDLMYFINGKLEGLGIDSYADTAVEPEEELHSAEEPMYSYFNNEEPYVHYYLCSNSSQKNSSDSQKGDSQKSQLYQLLDIEQLLEKYSNSRYWSKQVGTWRSHHLIDAWTSYNNQKHALKKAHVMGSKAKHFIELSKLDKNTNPTNKKKLLQAAENAKRAFDRYLEAAKFAEKATKLHLEATNIADGGKWNEKKLKYVVTNARKNCQLFDEKADEAFRFEVNSEALVPFHNVEM